MKTIYKLVITILVSFVFVSLTTPISAQEDFILTVGEDKVFTEFNYHDTWFSDDPYNSEPWPDNREAYSEDNQASVSLIATPGHAGQSHALIGIQFELDLGPYKWKEVKNWPLDITIDFSYNIEAYWVNDYGSANAGLNIIGFSDRIGFETSESGSRGNTISEKYSSTPEALEDEIIMFIDCQAHSVYKEEDPIGQIHSSSTTVTVDSIKFEFANKPPIASFTYSPAKPIVGENIIFDASASYDPDGTIVSYDWDFGDGTLAEGQIVTHTYTDPGDYTVSLTVTDNEGLSGYTILNIRVYDPGSLVTPPDLIGEFKGLSFRGFPTSGDIVSTQISIVNIGGAPTAIKQTIDIEIWLRPCFATNADQDIYVTTLYDISVSKLQPGRSKNCNVRLNLPVVSEGGVYKLFAKIDSSDDAEEFDEENNEAFSECFEIIVE